MNSIGLSRCFASLVAVLALCASPGFATGAKWTLGNAPGADFPLNTLSLDQGVPGDVNNPNQFPVYFVEVGAGFLGFLLDGSEWSNGLVKKIEDAHANNTNIAVYYDTDGNHSIKVSNTWWGPDLGGGVAKIAYISTGHR